MGVSTDFLLVLSLQRLEPFNGDERDFLVVNRGPEWL